jgi:hypothetical protein
MSFDPTALAQSAELASTFERAVLDELQLQVGFDTAFFAAPCEPATTVNIDAEKLAVALVRRDYARELAPHRPPASAMRCALVARAASIIGRGDSDRLRGQAAFARARPRP